MNHKIDRDTYIIPPNFIESGTFFGGMFKARNVIEAGILAFAIGVPVFSLLPLGLTARIIALCLTALPAALVALIGVSGESLSSFLLIFIKYLRNRRIVGGNSAEDAVPAAEHGGKHIKKKVHKPDKAPRRSRRSGREDFPAEFDEVRGYEIRQKLRPVKKQKPAKEKKTAKQKKKVSKERKVKRPIRTQEPKPACLNPVADYLPISKIENGIIYTKDHRYVKVVEVVPINFMLRSAQEQRNIIYSFVSYLKISPIKLQIKVLTRRAEINRHLDTVRKEMEQETNEQCLLMQEDYLQFVQQIGSREAITRRFFLIFEYEPWSNTKRSDEEGEAINALQSAVHTATNYLRQCGNEVIVPENWDEFTVDVLYNLLCRNESAVKPLSVRAQEVVAEYLAKGRDSEIDHIPATEFCAPKSIDFTHGHHICIDGLYYAYLLVPSDGYKTQVPAGWLSLIVNAGDGIDMDMFLSRQPKETIIQKVGQQLRINRSKIKDASDTNTDFDDIDGAIRSGYFLKEGLANNEDFYYLNLLITITASNEEDLEWKVSEMKKLLLSQDMNACTCHFREEQAFLICQQRLSPQFRHEDVHGLILGNSMDLAYQILTSTGGRKHDFFMLDGSYEHFLYLTNDHQGEVILALLCDPGKTAELDRILLQGLTARQPGLAIEHDGISPDGSPVLFGYFCDLPRIARFNTSLELSERPGTLICFDFQAEVLRSYCGSQVRFQTIDFTKFEGRLFP